MTVNRGVFVLFLRLSLAAGFFSAVASRLGFWGEISSGWSAFVANTAHTNVFLPTSTATVVAVLVTIVELVLGGLLLMGYRMRTAGLVAGVLTLIFAIAMCFSFGLKAPLDYAVFVFSGGCFLVATEQKHIISLDNFLNQHREN